MFTLQTCKKLMNFTIAPSAVYRIVQDLPLGLGIPLYVSALNRFHFQLQQLQQLICTAIPYVRFMQS